ncbi:unnamed protein product [Dicrocoelium dendriticum]|nr:unnamed protein product [Dicrocoelium dendriticum]
MATLFCLLTCLLGVCSDFVSITVAVDRRPYLDFMNQTIGSTVELHCGNQRSFFKLDSEAECLLHRWSYDPQTMELTCVCKMRAVKSEDRTLLQVGDSRAIFAIPEHRFVELDIVGQGSFAYELEILTTSDHKDTVLSLFPHNKTNGIALISKKCDSVENQTNIEFCFTVHGNREMVTWDYPENWIGPVRYLRNMAYDPITTIVRVAGIYWPKKQSGNSAPLHVDTVMTVGDSKADHCAIFFEKTRTMYWEWLMKCRVEFIEESVINPSSFLVKLNLLMPAEMGDNPITELTNLKLAKSLKPRYGTCMFPAHMRQEAAFYVPPRAPLTGKPFGESNHSSVD